MNYQTPFQRALNARELDRHKYETETAARLMRDYPDLFPTRSAALRQAAEWWTLDAPLRA